MYIVDIQHLHLETRIQIVSIFGNISISVKMATLFAKFQSQKLLIINTSPIIVYHNSMN